MKSVKLLLMVLGFYHSLESLLQDKFIKKFFITSSGPFMFYMYLYDPFGSYTSIRLRYEPTYFHMISQVAIILYRKKSIFLRDIVSYHDSHMYSIFYFTNLPFTLTTQLSYRG